jgi:hypothetical protein
MLRINVLSRHLLSFNPQEVLVLLILSTLPLSNFFMVFGFRADSGSRIIYVFWFIGTLYYYLKVRYIKNINVYYGIFLLILILSILLGAVKFIIDKNGYIDTFANNALFKALPKVFFLILIYCLIKDINPSRIYTVIVKYSFIIIITIPVSLLLYILMPMNRFVMYSHGAGNRFAAFHYELVNFSYSALFASVILTHRYIKNEFLRYLVLIILYAITYKYTLSNYLPLFLGSILWAILLLQFKYKKRTIIFSIYLLALFAILLVIPYLINNDLVNNILVLFPRSTLQLNEANPIYARLMVQFYAVEYFITNIFAIPNGLYNGDILEGTPPGAGITKIFVDLGFLSIPLFMLLASVCINAARRTVASNITDKSLFIVFNLSIIYVYLQSGFFNFTVISVCLLCLRYWRTI